jgi:hypothetical protein
VTPRAAMLVMALLTASVPMAPAQAQPDRVEENVTYAWAQVLHATPVVLDGRQVGYDVAYQYKGEQYMSRLPHDPGSRLRIRITVVPDLPGQARR